MADVGWTGASFGMSDDEISLSERQGDLLNCSSHRDYSATGGREPLSRPADKRGRCGVSPLERDETLARSQGKTFPVRAILQRWRPQKPPLQGPTGNGQLYCEVVGKQ